MLKKLKKGEIFCIPLADGYFLRKDEYNQYYLSRGGKKRYYLTYRFLMSLSRNRTFNVVDLKLISIHESILALKNKLRKGSLGRLGLEKILKEFGETDDGE